MIIRELSASQCGQVLATNRVARLACSRGDEPYVVPINYAFLEGSAYAFTVPGMKLDIMRSNPRVALLVEDHGARLGWISVVATGRFEELPDRIGHKLDRDRAWALLSQHADWWQPAALKPIEPPVADQTRHVYFRIHIDRMTGREAVEA